MQVESLQHASGGTVLKGYDVTRDVVGNPTQVTTTSSGVQSSALLRYDPADRLKFECYPTTGESCNSQSPARWHHYDKVGNRVSDTNRTVTANIGTGTTVSTVDTVSVFDAGDQLLSETVAGTASLTNTWTPNGELASSTTSAGTQSFDTDLSGELVSTTLTDGTTVGYTHDTTGNRTSRTVDGELDASWVWDTMSALPTRIGEYDASDVLETAWLPDPTSATGSALAQSIDGVSEWLLGDPFANTVVTVNTTGTTLSATRTMDAFGVNLTAATGTMTDSQLGFAGQYLDSVTGLYDMRARDYQPSTGAFTANDPVPVPTGMPYFSGNTYGFNNPMLYTDATGNWPTPNWGQVAKLVFAQPIALGQLAYGASYSQTFRGRMDLGISVGQMYVDNGGGWGGAWATANAHFNPMYAAISAGADGLDSMAEGNFGDTIGTYIARDGSSSRTSIGILHYRADGSAHIVPGRP